MDIDAKDCRLEGFSYGLVTCWTCWYRATHLPTGVVVEFKDGTTVKREAMERLQKAVNEAIANQQRKELRRELTSSTYRRLLRRAVASSPFRSITRR